jgi:periplasmic divalent cation tolerance protein
MYVIVSTTIDTKESAYQIANILVDKKLAACVQIELVNSVYTWKGKILDTEEYRLQIKTRENLYDDVAVQIRMAHTYETPEIIATPMSHISENYGTRMESVLKE